MKALIELQYLPPIAYFSILMKHETIWIEQYENYQKGSYRNRCEIGTSNGTLRLSIPLEKGKNNQTNIRDVKIYNATNWQIQHWRAIQSAYGKSPFFEYYADDLSPYFNKSFNFLFDWNLELLNLTTELIGLSTDFQLNTTYEFNQNDFWDYRNTITPKNSLQLPYQPKSYNQVFEDKHGFIPNLSILDLLFCKGPEATLVINDYLQLLNKI